MNREKVAALRAALTNPATWVALGELVIARSADLAAFATRVDGVLSAKVFDEDAARAVVRAFSEGMDNTLRLFAPTAGPNPLSDAVWVEQGVGMLRQFRDAGNEAPRRRRRARAQ